MKLMKVGDRYDWVETPPEFFKPGDCTLGYTKDIPLSWAVCYGGYARLYAAKPTRKQVRALVDFARDNTLREVK